ncbi:MAG: DUF885 domain-containing protein [Pseudomonadota bacterium]
MTIHRHILIFFITLFFYTHLNAKELPFETFTDRFIESFWEYQPDWAIFNGYYKHDTKVIIPNAANQKAYRQFLAQHLTALRQYSVADLSSSQQSDYYIIENLLLKGIWYHDELQSGTWAPNVYNVGSVIGLILNTPYKSLEDRLKVIYQRLMQVPAYYAAAQANITQPTKEHTQLAIDQNQGTYNLFNKNLPESLEKSQLDKEWKNKIKKANDKAQSAVKSYITFLEKTQKDLEKNGAREFRLGKALYDKKFKLEIFSGFSAEEVYQRAVKEKERAHKEMAVLAQKIWPNYFPKKSFPQDTLVGIKTLIDEMAKKHVAREQFVAEIQRQIPILAKFVDEKQLLDQDPTKPLVVRATPEYQRGIAGASINAPGPYDAAANTYYNVTPLDHYTPEQAESYLREYNHWILQILNIHEAIPGHYTQLLHSNRSKSLTKSLFGNGAMIEGWAVYSERMMLENGYGNHDPELWFMYYKWNLRVIINTILDYQVHVLGMKKSDGLNLLMNEGFQERTEAEGKWRRVTLTQVQLTSYFTGYAEIYKFREELKAEQGEKFDLKSFHNTFLSYGSSPVPIIIELMRK